MNRLVDDGRDARRHRQERERVGVRCRVRGVLGKARLERRDRLVQPSDQAAG